MSDDEYVDLNQLIGVETESESGESEDEYLPSHITTIRKRKRKESCLQTDPFLEEDPVSKINLVEVPVQIIYNYDMPELKSEQARLLIENPFDLFDFLYTDSINYLYECTSQKYFNAKQREMQDSSDTSFHFNPITLNEIKSFVGAILLMDIYQLPTVEMYFGRGKSILSVQEISSCFTYERFQEIRNILKTECHDKMTQSMCLKLSQLVHYSSHVVVD